MRNLSSITEKVYSIKQLRANLYYLQEESGVYRWIFSPFINCESEMTFIFSLEKIAKMSFRLHKKGKVDTTSVQLGYEAFTNKKLFSTDSSKFSELTTISGSEELRRIFSENLISLCQKSTLLYVGKADNIRDRLSDHLNGRNSTLLKDLEASGIEEDMIRISIEYDKVKYDGMNQILEELIQRIAEPGFVRRKG